MAKFLFSKLVPAVAALFILSAALVSADTVVNIYYTASLNGNLIGCDCSGVPKAGLSTTAVYIRGIDHKNSILLELGDFNDARTDELLADKLVGLFKELGYEIAALGDQELGSGIDYFKKISRKLDFICNNLEIDGRAVSREPVIIEKDGIKIGIAAVIDPAVFFFYPDELKKRLNITDPAKAAGDALSRLREKGTNFNLLLYHGNLESAQAVYSSQAGWDSVLSAHDQVVFSQQDGSRVLASPGEEGNRVGLLQLTFRSRRLSGISNSMRYFEYEKDPEDPEVLQVFEDYKNELVRKLKNGKN